MTATEELPAVAEPGLAMGRYRLGARLGAGGFGTVYAARDERLGRPVAVKVVPAEGTDPERAQREARAVARLDHEGIVALFDAGEEDGCRYLVSELVEGRTLAQLEADGALSDRDVLRIGLALTDALAHAHDRGVIHRDVKPQNVIVPDDAGSRRGAAKLTDFGVAHLTGEDALTRTGDVVGTLAYMAPEQASGARRGRARRPLRAGHRALRGARGRPSGPRRLADRHRAAHRHRAGPARAPSRRPAGRPLRGDRPRGPARAGGARRARGPLRRAGGRAARRLRRGRDDRAAPARAPGPGPPTRGRPRRRPRRDGRARLCRARRAHARAGGRARRGRRRRRRGSPPCSPARAGWRRALAVAGLLTFSPEPRPGAALLVLRARARPRAAPAPRRARVGAARRRAAARPRRPRRRLSRARRPRTGLGRPRRARGARAPGGSCWRSRCWSARWCSARRRARPRGPRSTAPPASPPAT